MFVVIKGCKKLFNWNVTAVIKTGNEKKNEIIACL